eukprot:403330642
MNSRSSNSSTISSSYSGSTLQKGSGPVVANQEHLNMLKLYQNHQASNYHDSGNMNTATTGVNTLSNSNTLSAAATNSILSQNNNNSHLKMSMINQSNQVRKNNSIIQANLPLQQNNITSQRSNSSLRHQNQLSVQHSQGQSQGSITSSQLKNQLKKNAIKEIPSMRSFACAVNEDSSKEIEREMRGKVKMDQALNRDRIMMPQDSKGLIMLYGGTKDERRRQNSKDSFERSLDEQFGDENKNTSNFKQRSNSLLSTQMKLQHSRMGSKAIRDQSNNKRINSSSVFGCVGQEKQKVYEISSYKRDAANLMANRIMKKVRGYFVILQDFAAFQEEVQAMANYNSKFNINQAFEDFKQKQDEKSKTGQDLVIKKECKKFSQSQAIYDNSKSNNRWQQMTHIQDNFIKELSDNVFLSQDKMMSQTYAAGNVTSNLKIKIQSSKDHTPVNIFQTYLKSNNIVSPIPMETQPTDFYDLEGEEEFFDFNQKLGLPSSGHHKDSIKQKSDSVTHHQQNNQESVMKNIKNTFRNKVKNIKSDFNNLLSAREAKQQETDQFMECGQEQQYQLMTQRCNPSEDKENNFNFSNNKTSQMRDVMSFKNKKTTQIKRDKINIQTSVPLSTVNQRKNLKIVQLNSRDEEQLTTQETLASNYNMNEELYLKIQEKLLGIIQYKELKHKFLYFMSWKQLSLQNGQSAQESLHISHISVAPQ